MLTIDELVIWSSIVAMSAAAVVLGTWWPTARKVFCGVRTRINYIALGVALAAFTEITSRLYSLVLREYQAVWLRQTWIPVGAIFMEAIAFTVLALAYFSQSRQRDLTPVHYRGLWWGVGAFGLLVAVKVLT